VKNIEYSLALYDSKKPEKIEAGIWLLKETIDKIKKKGSTDFPGLLSYSLHKLSSIYYELGDFHNAIIYGKKSLAFGFLKDPIPNVGPISPVRNLNNLGVFYRE
jgi:hypothetical protein